MFLVTWYQMVTDQVVSRHSRDEQILERLGMDLDSASSSHKRCVGVAASRAIVKISPPRDEQRNFQQTSPSGSDVS